MSSSVSVDAVTNLHTGTTVDVQLSGVPAGNLEIWASEVADGPEFGCPYSDQGGGHYTVTLPARGIWNVWAKDSGGFGTQFGSVYMGVGDDADTDAIGKWIQDTLIRNKPGMEAMIRTWYPKTTIKQIHYGVAASLMDFPSICICNPRANWQWAAMPFGKEWTYTFSIACDAQRSEEETETPLATRMMEAAMHILNFRRYNGFTVAGQPFWDCGANEGDATEVEVPQVGWIAIASLVWSGKALKQVAGPHF